MSYSVSAQYELHGSSRYATVHRLSYTGRAEPEDCHSASASSSGTPTIRPSMTRFARLYKKRCRDSEPSPGKLSGTAPLLRFAPGWLRSDPTIFPTNHRDSTLLSPTAPRGRNRLRYLQWDAKEVPLNPRVNIIYRDCVTFGDPSPKVSASHTI